MGEEKEDEGEISTFGLHRPELSFGISRRRDDGFGRRSQPAGRERIVPCLLLFFLSFLLLLSLFLSLPPLLCSGQFRRLYETIERDRHITKSTWLHTRKEKKRKRTRYFVILIDLPIRGTEDTHGWLIIKVNTRLSIH